MHNKIIIFLLGMVMQKLDPRVESMYEGVRDVLTRCETAEPLI